MASQEQIVANKQNSLKHGLTSGFTLLSNESQQDFDNLLASLEAEFQPAGEHQKFLVTVMAESRWKRDRAHRLEAAYFERALNGEEVDSKIALMHRYATAAERAYHKAHKELIEDAKLIASLQQPEEQAEEDPEAATEQYLATPEGQAALKARTDAFLNSFRKSGAVVTDAA